MPEQNWAIKELNEFRWDDVPLKMGPSSWAKCKNLLDHTAWIVEQLRTCPFGTARLMLQNSTVSHLNSGWGKIGFCSKALSCFLSFSSFIEYLLNEFYFLFSFFPSEL